MNMKNGFLPTENKFEHKKITLTFVNSLLIHY